MFASVPLGRTNFVAIKARCYLVTHTNTSVANVSGLLVLGRELLGVGLDGDCWQLAQLVDNVKMFE